MTCNVLVPQLFWAQKFRRSIPVMFVASILINVGMWFERFVIVATSLANDFLPSSWDYYIPTIWDVLTYVGTFGLFFTFQLINHELKLAKLKSDFIATVSHEFKSPLTAIRQMSEMLADQRIRAESRKSQYYQLIRQESERLSHLVENILDFSKLEE